MGNFTFDVYNLLWSLNIWNVLNSLPILTDVEGAERVWYLESWLSSVNFNIREGEWYGDIMSKYIELLRFQFHVLLRFLP